MKIDFKEQLGEGQHVEIRDPKRLSWGDQKAITLALKDENIEGQLETAERITIALVKSGYVLDADDKPITFPLNEDNVKNVPSVVIEEVAKKFADVRTTVTPKN